MGNSHRAFRGRWEDRSVPVHPDPTPMLPSLLLIILEPELVTGLPDFTPEMGVVFALVLLALVLFVTEIIPVDVTAIVLMVLVVVLGPWTGVGPDEGLSGFSSQATITVLAMFILSEGIRRTGVLQVVGNRIIQVTGGKPKRQLAALVGLSGGTAGFINNTPVVAMMIPMAVNIANRTRVSPSRYLIPISFASMMGGMLTLIGTSTNLLASDVSERLLDRPFSMFEFTQLGLLVLVVGSIYLLLVGWALTPARIRPREDPMETFEMDDYLTELHVREGSSLAGLTVQAMVETLDVDLDVLRIRRDDARLEQPLGGRRIREGDILIARTDPSTVRKLLDLPDVALGGGGPVQRVDLGMKPDPSLGQDPDEPDEEEEDPADAPRQSLVELVVLSDTRVAGETLSSLSFAQAFDAWVLAIRRGRGVLHKRLDRIRLKGGDTLLVQAGPDAVRRLQADRNFIVSRVIEDSGFRRERIPVALGIVGAVVLAATTGILPIVTAALAGVVAMVATRCLQPNELYAAVDWNVIFLLAGVIPLGIALERSGGAEFLGQLLVAGSYGLPPVIVVGIFYLFTALITNVVSNNASVVLMIPVAVSAAAALDANPFAFVMAVTFAASTALLTPVGYQTNLMVYGPGGYRFSDFFRVGAPLQLILTVVTTLGIGVIWGV